MKKNKKIEDTLKDILKEIENEISRVNTRARGSIVEGTSVTGLRKAQDIINNYISKNYEEKNVLIEAIENNDPKFEDLINNYSYKGKDIKKVLEYILICNKFTNDLRLGAEYAIAKFYINTIRPVSSEVYYFIKIYNDGSIYLKRDYNKSPRVKEDKQ